ALVAAELVLDVGGGLEQRRDDGAGGRIGLLARVNADGGEAGGVGELHNRRCYHSARTSHAALPTPRSTAHESTHATRAARIRSAARRSHAVTARADALPPTWPGRLFLVAAGLKVVVAVLRRATGLTDALEVVSSAATIGLILSVG